MSKDVFVRHDVVIPSHELDISTSRSGGAGGQHVNKTDTRITVRWNVRTTRALTDEQKERVLQKLANRLTNDGELIIHNSASRSQQQNREHALEQLAQEIRQALHVPKKRMKTRIAKHTKEARLEKKTQRSELKKSRSKKIFYE
ncbi:MAG: alternative ribosome rescue aminoacyl-tRNA hydrolase ArfB [Candidatus Babeliales bacterium]